MKKLFQNIAVACAILILLVFSSGVHLYQHYCYADCNLEFVFSQDDIKCHHHSHCDNSSNHDHNCECSHNHSDNPDGDDETILVKQLCSLTSIVLEVHDFCNSTGDGNSDYEDDNFHQVHHFIHFEDVALLPLVNKILKFSDIFCYKSVLTERNLFDIFHCAKIIPSNNM